MADPAIFHPLSDEEVNATAAIASSAFTPIIPVPDEVRGWFPPHRLGKPSARWVYRDAGGQRLFVVARLDHERGKDVLPLTWCEGPDGQRAWRWQGLPAPRPLYGLDRLAERPDAPVIVVEGEKAAHAAAGLLPDHVVVTSPGGAKAADKADWSPLAGREVTVWPDADDAGASYAHDVARLSHKAGAASVAVVDVPEGLPDAWDLADPAPEAWDETTISQLLSAARQSRPEQHRDGVTLTRASDITPEAIDWIWEGWLASGKLHLLAGAAGTGKTTIALAMAAAITQGRSWPDGTQAPVGDVLIWTGEDDLADTLVPRLMAAGANLERVHIIDGVQKGAVKRPFDPANDMADLKEAIRQIGQIKLVIIDPILSATKGDSHKAAEVRRDLQPVVDLGREVGAAVLGVTHFAKGTGGRDPLERVIGSQAFGALARLVMVTAKPGDESASRRLVRAKSNIGPDGGGFDYDLEQVVIGEGLAAQTIRWGDAIDGGARKLLAEVEATGGDGTRTALDEAIEFLDDLLADGPLPATEIFRQGKDAGLSEKTIRRAKMRLGIEKAKAGMRGGWVWQKPDPSRRWPIFPEDGQPETLATFGNLGHLRGADEWEEDL